MVLKTFIGRASRRELWIMCGLALLAGVANAVLVVAVINMAKAVAVGKHAGPLEWGSFLIAFLVYYQGNKMALVRANIIIERLLKDLRLSVMDRIRRTELQTLEKLGRGDLYTLVSQETNHLSVTFPMLVDSLQQAILLTVSLFYLAFLSFEVFLGFLLAVMGGYLSYRMINQSFRLTARLINIRQAHMVDAIDDIIHGSKELRLNNRKSDDVFSQYKKTSGAAEALLVMSGEHWASLLLLGSLVTYSLLGAVAFIFPAEVSGFRDVVFEVIPVLLFCMGALTKIAAQSPMFLRADVGLQAILDIDRKLEEGGDISPDKARKEAPRYRNFDTLTFDDLAFSYKDKDGESLFSVGPLDFSVHRGETVFLVGGNGCGKSTVLRNITGLLPLDSGVIRVDRTPLTGTSIAGYRELFSAVFVDFHLFDRLYGLEEVNPDEVNQMIDDMGLSGKVLFEDGRFTQLTLSTGQRKRLALIAALMEDRPVYIFDEWSAEQDVHFREKFYTEIIPGLKAKGKTVIAVTHDQRFWHLADRVIKMDLGRIEWDRAGSELESE
ncbi:MAG: cyclic peptide export ABC transporter [Halopseudomonas aestusnigri]